MLTPPPSHPQRHSLPLWTPTRIIPPSHSFAEVMFFEWLQSSGFWPMGATQALISLHLSKCVSWRQDKPPRQRPEQKHQS